MSVVVTPRVRAIGGMFGIAVREAGAWTRPQALDIPRAGITLITGASGSGKSTLLRVIEETLHAGEGVGPGIQSLGLNGARFRHVREFLGLVERDPIIREWIISGPFLANQWIRGMMRFGPE
jgi:ABC-type transport system involved in cytochrome bd biosynthesis fused ATPase/permease subunit